MREISDKEFEEFVENNSKVVLLDVYGTWCGPCRMLAPILEEIQEENSDWLEVIKADVDTSDKIVNRLGVTSVPSLFVFKNGVEVDRVVGYRPKSQLQEFVESYK